MIKCEINDKGEGKVEIKGNDLMVILEMKKIIDAFAEDKSPVLETIFLDLSKHFTKEECYGYIQAAYNAQEQSEELHNTLNDMIKELIDKLGEN